LTEADARLWHPWLRINRVLRVMSVERLAGVMLFAALLAFFQEHQYCGELDGGVEGDRVWRSSVIRSTVDRGPTRARPWPSLDRGARLRRVLSPLTGDLRPNRLLRARAAAEQSQSDRR